MISLTILIGLIVGLIAYFYKKDTISKKIDELKLELLKEQEKLEKGISNKHKNLGSDVSGNYKNLGVKMTNEHLTIKNDTKPMYDMMIKEEANRKKLYDSTPRAQEILDTMDVMREAVNQIANLNEKVVLLQTENQVLSKSKTNDELEELMSIIKSFEQKLAEFEDFRETEEIQTSLKTIASELSRFEK